MAVAGSPFFFVGGPGSLANRIFHTAWDLGHILFFSLVSWLLLSLSSMKKKEEQTSRMFARVFFLVLIAGIIVELLQMTFTRRSPDLFDVLRNQTGCLLVCAFFRSHGLQGVSRSLHHRLFQGGVVCLFLAALWPLFKTVTDEVLLNRQFPVLSSFETPFETSRWVDERQVSRERVIVHDGRGAMKVRLSTAMYSGTSLVHFPPDWSGFKTLRLSVFNPGWEELTLHCRIHDREHKHHGQLYGDRFHAKFVLKHGWNDLQISLEKVRGAPMEREMEMDKIERLGLFVVKQSVPKVIYLDDVALVR